MGSFYETWVYNVLRDDEEYRKYVDQFVPPSEWVEREAEISSAIGFIMGKVIGIGWQTSAINPGTITIKNSPMSSMRIYGPLIVFYFPARKLPTYDNYGLMKIKPVRKGLFHARTVGIKLESSCAGRESIEADRELMDDVARLFKTERLFNMKEARAPMVVGVGIAERDRIIGIITACADFSSDRKYSAGPPGNECVKLLFKCADRLAGHISRGHTTLYLQQIASTKTCRNCFFFGKGGCKRQENDPKATPCEDFTP